MKIYYSRAENPKTADALELLRRAIGYLPEIAKDENGKPFFKDLPRLCFSYSHTKGLVMCVLSEYPVGADCEKIRPVSERLVQRLMTERELEFFGFFELWTMRESLYKLLGRGNLMKSDFIIADGGGVTVPGEPDIKFIRLPEIYGCAACVCTRNPAAVTEPIEVTKITAETAETAEVTETTA